MEGCDVAFEPGKYSNFNGWIFYGGVDGFVYQATFEIVDMDSYKWIEFMDGIWLNGTFDKAEWKGGQWRNGTFKSGAIWRLGEWLNGTFDGGMWLDGIWRNGLWQDGTWSNGIWCDGEWINGIWEDGEWRKGKKHCMTIGIPEV